MRWIIATVLLLPLAACMQDRPPPPPSATASPTPGTIEDQFAPVTRAKDVEGDVLEAKEATDAALEQQGG